MARVNHKRVKQLLNEKRSKITDRQFFTSRILAGHFEDMAMAQTRRYKYNRRIHVAISWNPKSGEVACTNNLLVLINAGHQLVTQNRGRENRYEIVCGLFAHELGHCLYTDFLAGQTYDNYLSREKWYPEPPAYKLPRDAANERALWEYVRLEPQNNELLRHVAHHISNVIEDAYIENRILAQFRGTLGNCLEALREQQYESIPTVTELIEKEDDGSCHIFESILQIMLSYVKYGEIKYGDAPLSDERVQVVFKLIHELDAAIVNPSGKERLKAVNLILVRCWNYIEDFLEVCKKRQEEARASGSTASLAETLAQILQAMAGSSETGEGNSTPVPEAGAVCVAAGAGKRAQMVAQATKSESGEGGGSEVAEPQTEPELENSSAGASKTEKPKEGCAIVGDMASDSGEKQGVSAEETGRLPYQQTDRVSEGSGGTTERNDAYVREHYDHAAEDIERLMDKMAERAACEQLENERTRELNDAAQSISYGDVHAGVDIRVNRISSVDEELVEQYNAISGPLLDISRQLQKSLLQQLKDKQRGGKQTGLMMGRRLDAHALCRNDGKVFYKNALPNEIPQMSVGLLLDESGSMCSCDRCTYARSSAIILYDFCKALHIPVTVYGHSTSGSSVELYSYAEFESIDNDDKYRMMDIAARGSNRDGAALRFVAEQLVKRGRRR